MKFKVSPLIRKIANVGTTIALINNGENPQMAARYGQLAEGMLSGFMLEKPEEDVVTRLKNTFVDSTYQVLTYDSEIEIGYETAKGIANDLFNLENFHQYMLSTDSEALMGDKFKECCLKYNIPFIEQDLDVSHIVENIVLKINNHIINDIHFLLIFLLITSNKSRQDDVNGFGLCGVGRKSFKHDQKKQFIGKWESGLFLHKHIKFCDFYFPPNFSCKEYGTDQIEKLLLNYLADENKQVLFLFGNPGLGKSSLMHYFAKIFENEDNYIFIKMFDLESRTAKDYSLVDAIAEYLLCKKNDLKNKVLFLDGYDELRVDSKHYDLCLAFITELRQIKAKAIISSRLNYIDLNKKQFNKDFLNSVVVELQPFNKDQMIEYIEKFEDVLKTPIDKVKQSFKNKTTEVEVYGSPFILYLICSLNIDISQMTDMLSIYDKVFAFDGGLYDKIYDEEEGHYLTQNPQCKRDLLNISMELAYKMFNTGKLYVDKKIVNELIINKYPQMENTYALGNYYYIEKDRLYFEHNTFQEYFACRYLLSELENLMNKYINAQIKIEEAVKHIFDILFCDNYLFKRIEHILLNMFQNDEAIQTEQYKKVFCEFTSYLYDLYLNNIYMDTSPRNNILKSQNYLSSLHKIINFFGIETFTGVNQYKISLILRNKYYVIMNINNLRLKNADLSGAYLRGTFNLCEFHDVNFCRCDLHNSLIKNTHITHCKSSMVYARKTDFINVKVNNSKLTCSNMSETNYNATIFEESTITGVDFSYSKFNKCIFKNTRFIECDFSYADLIDIEGGIMFDACTFTGITFLNIAADLSFIGCDVDDIIQSIDSDVDKINIMENREENIFYIFPQGDKKE